MLDDVTLASDTDLGSNWSYSPVKIKVKIYGVVSWFQILA